MSKIPEGKQVIADEGCIGEPTKVSTHNDFDSENVKILKCRAKARQKTVNQKIKMFGILNQTFHTTGKMYLEKHRAAFEVYLVIVQYELDNGSGELMKV
eukprot:15357116-Ditylum_brightwellii.AAC.1